MEWLYALDYHHWIVLGLMLLVLELLVGGSLLMWNGLAIILVGLVVLVLPAIGVYPGWEMQLMMVLAGVLMALAVWRRYVRVPAVHHLGEELVLSEPIEHGRGHVSIEGVRWVVHGPDLPEGTRVRLMELDGMAFRVVPVDNPRP
jgi:inner membrane protein